MLLKLAWRNIWRTKKRTFITIAMVMLAVFLAIVMNSFQRGVHERNINNILKFSTGYIQVSAAGHKEDKSFDTALELDEKLLKTIEKTDGVDFVIPKIESFSLASSDSVSKDAIILSVEPELERSISHLDDRLLSGSYFDGSSNQIIVAKGLLKRLKCGLNDTIVLLGMGFQGNTAADKFTIAGVVSLGSPDLNNRVIYMPIKDAQNYFSLENRVSSLSIMVEDLSKSTPVANSLNKKLDLEKYEIASWKDLVPELASLMESDQASGYIFMGILYLLISFGIFGTILMMLAERRYEFGVVTSLGMKRKKLGIMVALEIFILGILGAIAGMALSVPLVLYFKKNPIKLAGDMAQFYENFGFEPTLQTGFFPDALVNNALLVLLILVILLIYPLIKILSLKPIEYLRS